MVIVNSKINFASSFLFIYKYIWVNYWWNVNSKWLSTNVCLKIDTLMSTNSRLNICVLHCYGIFSPFKTTFGPTLAVVAVVGPRLINLKQAYTLIISYNYTVIPFIFVYRICLEYSFAGVWLECITTESLIPFNRFFFNRNIPLCCRITKYANGGDKLDIKKK